MFPPVVYVRATQTGGGMGRREANLLAVHGKGGQVVCVLLVPAESEEGTLDCVLIQNGGVLQVPAYGRHIHMDGSDLS